MAETKVYVLKDSDLALIPEEGKKILSVPLPDTVSTEKIFDNYKEEYKSDSAQKGDLKNGPTSGFMAILERETLNGFTHIAFGDYKFKYSEQYKTIYRSKYNPNASTGGGGSRKSFTPRAKQFLVETFFGTSKEVNELVVRGDWELAYPAVVSGEKFLIVKTRKEDQKPLEVPVPSS